MQLNNRFASVPLFNMVSLVSMFLLALWMIGSALLEAYQFHILQRFHEYAAFLEVFAQIYSYVGAGLVALTIASFLANLMYRNR